ncbi:bublin coiled-coil protein isoform X2 [Bos javanicus]|uniref:bublin coiled-coil protein isoform X2 n=1 Tax=Bos javanicus TaxID=9906 RepID=UPI002AA946B4|nr:bublin coiled-coil protein isoform X2 [Bos javanicus]
MVQLGRQDTGGPWETGQSGRSSTVRQSVGGALWGRSLELGRGRGSGGRAPWRRSSSLRAPPWGRVPAAPARSAAAFHPSGSEFHSPPPPSAPRRLSARPSPRSIFARPLRRPSPQCRAPTGTWARRWSRARKARKTASGKQKSAVTCRDGEELGLKPKGPCSASTTNQLQDPRIRCHQLHVGPDQLLSGPPGGEK